MNHILGFGAEAVVVRLDAQTVQKQRMIKAYRHLILDQSLRKSRTRREAKVFERLSSINFPAPKLIRVDDKAMTLDMSFIDGIQLHQVFEKNPLHYAREIGTHVAFLHKNHIIHGDLTTSNILLASNKLVFIDFGLSFFSHKSEDKATDLHVLLQGIQALYQENVKNTLLEAYAAEYAEAANVLQRLRQVEERGRNKKKDA